MFRNKLAHYFLPSSDEWYKAAYYDPAGDRYFDYPTGSDNEPTPVLSGTAPGTAVYRGTDPGTDVYAQMLGPADVTQAGGLSPNGTMGQGGNILEWEETDYYFLNDSTYYGHGVRGGYWNAVPYDQKSTYRDGADIDFQWGALGFRVASAAVPEPSSVFLVTAAAGLLCAHRRLVPRHCG